MLDFFSIYCTSLDLIIFLYHVDTLRSSNDDFKAFFSDELTKKVLA